jgi:hypothetical protein
MMKIRKSYLAEIRSKFLGKPLIQPGPNSLTLRYGSDLFGF